MSSVHEKSDKKKTLTLSGGSKLTLNRSKNTQKSISGGGNSVIVEVKRGKAVQNNIRLHRDLTEDDTKESG